MADKDHMATVHGKNLPISTKQAVEIGKFIIMKNLRKFKKKSVKREIQSSKKKSLAQKKSQSSKNTSKIYNDLSSGSKEKNQLEK